MVAPSDCYTGDCSSVVESLFPGRNSLLPTDDTQGGSFQMHDLRQLPLHEEHENGLMPSGNSIAALFRFLQNVMLINISMLSLSNNDWY